MFEFSKDINNNLNNNEISFVESFLRMLMLTFVLLRENYWLWILCDHLCHLCLGDEHVNDCMFVFVDVYFCLSVQVRVCELGELSSYLFYSLLLTCPCVQAPLRP